MQYEAKSQANQYAAGAATGMLNSPTAPPQPTLFSGYAGQLEARVAHMAGLVERLSRVADRLGGSVPEEAQTGGKLRGSGGSVAAQIEISLEDLDGITRRGERVTERLERM